MIYSPGPVALNRMGFFEFSKCVEGTDIDGGLHLFIFHLPYNNQESRPILGRQLKVTTNSSDENIANQLIMDDGEANIKKGQLEISSMHHYSCAALPF